MTDETDKKTTNIADAELASKTWDILASIGIGWSVGVPIPPSVIKSLRKAVSRLISGTTDYGMTYIEGATARRKMLTKGKQIVLHQAAMAAADKVASDDHLLERAIDVFATELIAKQTNKEKVLSLTVNELNAVKSFNASDNIIDDDWLGVFSRLASEKSNAEVQQLLAKILSGEIQNPGTFSPLTLHILSTLTPAIAKTFEQVCNLSILWKPDEDQNVAIIYHLAYSKFREHGIPEYGISYGDFMTLQNYGLVLPNLNAVMTEDEPLLELPIEIGERKIKLKSISDNPTILSLQGVAPLSLSGTELRKIISLKVPPVYLQGQIELFNKLGYNAIEC